MTSKSGGFKRVEKKAVANEIIEQIAARVRSGELKPGDRLPSELDLVSALGVGRSSVREALKGLEVLGVITRASGGTYISEDFPLGAFSQFLSAEMVSLRLQVADVYEARRILEVELGLIAVDHFTTDEHETLLELCEKMESLGVEEIDVYAAHDRVFHRTICLLAGNPILTRMWELSYELFIEMRLSAPISKEFLRVSNERHRKLVTALLDGDKSLVRETIMASLRLGESDIMESLGR